MTNSITIARLTEEVEAIQQRLLDLDPNLEPYWEAYREEQAKLEEIDRLRKEG